MADSAALAETHGKHCTWHVVLRPLLEALRSEAVLVLLLLVQHGLRHWAVSLLHLLHRLCTARSISTHPSITETH